MNSRFPSSGLVLVLTVMAAFRVAGATPSPGSGPNSVAIEALQRLKGLDLEANPAVKAALLKVLDSTRGTAQFVELVRDFDLAGQEAGLLDAAVRLSSESAGAEAARLLVQGGHTNLLRAALKEGPPDRAEHLVQSLANCGDNHALPMLSETAVDLSASAAARSAAVRGLARVEDGARELLRLGRESRLDDAARTTASLALARCRWPAVRDEAAQVFPLPRSADGSELPPPAELARLEGDAVRGAAIFRGEQAGCIKCHRVGEEGVDFGPALTQIGSKLGKEALHESILDPSSGISFGYEGWSIEMKDGDEVFGIVASETPDELAIKQQTGIVVRLKKSDIQRREQQKLSIMPGGMGEIMTREQLVDLVEYLTTLKAPPGP